MSAGKNIFRNVERDYPDYLRDESRRMGAADSISFPTSEQAIKDRLAEVQKSDGPITVQGARTGITGGAVPDGGHIMSLVRMNKIIGLRRDPLSGGFLLTVQPGALLSDIRLALSKKEFAAEAWSPESSAALGEFLRDKAYFFPPDPTETSASIGGMAACNASGARSFFYGATRKYVNRLRIVPADGSSFCLERGQQRANGRAFSVKTDSGHLIEGTLPEYEMPDVKNAAGYFARDDMDMIDLFIGSEGTLGIFSEIEILSVPAPDVIWGVMTFFPSEDAAARFAQLVRRGERRPAAVEFMDHKALNLLRRQKKNHAALRDMPDIPEQWHTSIYIEYHAQDNEVAEEALAGMSKMMADCGGDEDATWLATDAREMERLKDFRHAVPEAVNVLIDERRREEPRLTKLGTDLAVPDTALENMLALYHQGIDDARLDSVMFGHIGDNHIHVNIIPKTLDEYERGKKLYLEWAAAAVEMGGTVSAEHGIGKLKIEMLEKMFLREQLAQMRNVKRTFDPNCVLNRGNLFRA